MDFPNITKRQVIAPLLALVLCTTFVGALRCNKCYRVSSPSSCTRSDTCHDGEVCYAGISTHNGKDVFTAGCGHSYAHCRGFLFGFVRSDQQCCKDDMCNGEMLKLLSVSNTSPAATNPPHPPGTTLYPSFVLTQGIQCHVCSGGDCGVKGFDPVIHCPNGFPYCMNIVQNDAAGDKYVTKRCASIDSCMQKTAELQKTNNSAVCETFDAAEIYQNTFECTYCCETGYCNKHIVPPPETRISGTR